MFQSVALVFLACGIATTAASTTVAGSTELRCQADNGTLLASATVCSDSLSGCESIFGSAASGSTRPTLCDNEDMQDKAAQCAKTCGICCEQPAYDCLDATTSPVNCTTNKRFCTNANWTDVMAQYCPATCGLCTTGSCTDAIGGCSSMAALCENINWYTYMQQNCARTCGTCSSSGSGTSSTCSDVASNCAANSNLCDNSVYYSLMTTNCAKTCNRCGSSGGSGSTCTNANANCATWVSNGFCSSTFYTSAQKQQYCAQSCSLC